MYAVRQALQECRAHQRAIVQQWQADAQCVDEQHAKRPDIGGRLAGAQQALCAVKALWSVEQWEVRTRRGEVVEVGCVASSRVRRAAHGAECNHKVLPEHPAVVVRGARGRHADEDARVTQVPVREAGCM
jgi:hypothetical protein